MRSLDSLGAANLRHRRGRSALTAFGVVLGVAVLLGIIAAGASVNTGIHNEIRSFTGHANALVEPIGDTTATLPPSTLSRVTATPGVTLVTAGLAATATLDGSNQPLAGVDTNAAAVTDLYLTKGRLPAAGSNDITVSVQSGDRAPALGSSLPMVTRVGTINFRVVGLIDAARASLFGSISTDLISLSTAQRIIGRGAVVSHISVVLAPGVSTTNWVSQYHHAFAGAAVINVSKLAGGFTSFLRTIDSALTLFAFLALFVGGFLIYLTLSIAVVERTAVYGTLRALGASQRQVLRVVVMEALTLGVVATIVGIGVGIALAFGLLHLLSSALQLEHTPPLSIPPGAVVISALVGVIVTVAAAVLPARRASRLSPAVAMRGDIAAGAKLSRAWIVGIVALVAGFALGFAGDTATLGGPAAFLMLLGGVLVVPPLLSPLARVIGKATTRLSPGAGDITVMHLVKERSRSAYTLALVMVVLAMAVAIGATQTSMGNALNRVVQRQYGADLDVLSPAAMTPLEVNAIKSLPGVTKTTGVGFGGSGIVDSADTAVDLYIVDPSTYFAVSGFAWIKGSDATANSALAKGGGLLVPGVLADSKHLKIGSPLTLRTNGGQHTFSVVGVYAAFSTSTVPVVVVGSSDGARYFGSTAPSGMEADIAPGLNPAQVAANARVLLHAGSSFDYQHTQLQIIDTATVKRDATAKLDGFFTIFDVVLLVALIVGLLGLANTLAISVVQRYREIGLLRSVGAVRRQMFRSVVTEATTMVAVAFVLAIPLGFLVSVQLLYSVAHQLGYTVSYEFPGASLPGLAIIAAAVSFLAAIAPARRAARLTVVEALRVD